MKQQRKLSSTTKTKNCELEDSVPIIADVYREALTSSLADLPIDVILCIAEYLNPTDLCRLSCTCRRLHLTTESDLIWRPLTISELYYGGNGELIEQLTKVYNSLSTRHSRARNSSTKYRTPRGRIRRRTSSGDANTTTEREVHPLTTILDDSGTPSRFWKNAFKQYCVFYMKDPVARSIECVMTITKSEALRRRNARLREINTPNNYGRVLEGSESSDEDSDDELLSERITCLQVVAWPLRACVKGLKYHFESQSGSDASVDEEETFLAYIPCWMRQDILLLLAASSQDVIDIYNARTGDILTTLDAPPPCSIGIRSMLVTYVERKWFNQWKDLDENDGFNLFHPADRRAHLKPLIVCASGKNIKIWDMETGNLVQLLQGHTRNINCLAVARCPTTGTYIVISGSQLVCVWNLRSGENIKTIKLSNKVGACDITSLQVIPNSEGKILIAASRDDEISIWDVMDGWCLRTFSVSSYCSLAQVLCLQALVDSSTKRTLLITAERSKLSEWDVQTGNCVRDIVHVLDQKSVKCLAMSHGTIACGLSNGYIKIYDYQTGDYVTTLVSHDALVTSIQTFHGTIFTSSTDGTIKLWRPT